MINTIILFISFILGIIMSLLLIYEGLKIKEEENLYTILIIGLIFLIMVIALLVICCTGKYSYTPAHNTLDFWSETIEG